MELLQRIVIKRDLFYVVPHLGLVCLMFGLAKPIDLSECDATAQRGNDTICYQLMRDNKISMQEALDLCQSEGGKLPVVASKQENDVIAKLLEDERKFDAWLGVREVHYAWRWLAGPEVDKQGCFQDSKDDPDFSYEIYIKNNTQRLCIDECYLRSKQYAAVQAETACWCGDSFGKYGQTDLCNFRCPGNNDDLCGGTLANNVLSVYGASSNWDEGQPNNHLQYQTCAEMDVVSEYRWNDINCNQRLPVICQYDPCTTDIQIPYELIYGVGDKCYFVIPEKNRWWESRELCIKLKADMATFLVKEDLPIVENYIKNVTSNNSEWQKFESFWFGLYKWKWEWTTGEDVVYTYWDYDQPKGHDQSCATIMKEVGVWRDSSCDGIHPVVCQFDNSSLGITRPRSTPAPPTPFQRPSTTPPTTTPTTPRQRTPSTPSTTTPEPFHDVKEFFDRTEVMAGFIAAGAVVIIVIIIAISVVCYKKRKRPYLAKAENANYEYAEPPEPDHFFGLDAQEEESSTMTNNNAAVGTGFDTAEKHQMHNGPPDVVPK